MSGTKVATITIMTAQISESILLCSHDPLLTKQLYGPLSDFGYMVEISEHAAEAIKCILGKRYLVVILDARDVGLNVIEAATIIKSLSPDIYILIIGEYDNASEAYSVKKPEDLERLLEFISKLSCLKVKASLEKKS